MLSDLERSKFGKVITAAAGPQLLPGAVFALAGEGDYRSLIAALKLPSRDEALLISLVAGGKDYLADLPLQNKEAYLRSNSYADFLYKKVGMSPPGARLIEPWAQAYWSQPANSAWLMSCSQMTSHSSRSAQYLSNTREFSWTVDIELILWSRTG